MLKVGFRSSVVKAVLKIKSICNRKWARCSFRGACFLVVIIVGRREEYSLQIMGWVGNAEVSTIWKHFILTVYLVIAFLYMPHRMSFLEAFFLLCVHSQEINLCIGLLLIGICLLCGHSLLDSNTFPVFEPYHSLFCRTRYRYMNKLRFLGDRIYHEEQLFGKKSSYLINIQHLFSRFTGRNLIVFININSKHLWRCLGECESSKILIICDAKSFICEVMRIWKKNPQQNLNLGDERRG